MKTVTSSMSATTTDVLFDNFLDAFVQIHKLKPKDHGFLKFKIFAFLYDTEGRGVITKDELKQSIYHACLNAVLLPLL